MWVRFPPEPLKQKNPLSFIREGIFRFSGPEVKLAQQISTSGHYLFSFIKSSINRFDSILVSSTEEEKPLSIYFGRGFSLQRRPEVKAHRFLLRATFRIFLVFWCSHAKGSSCIIRIFHGYISKTACQFR